MFLAIAIDIKGLDAAIDAAIAAQKGEKHGA